MNLFSLARPLLHRLDAETAHRLTIAALKRLPPPSAPPRDPRLETRCFGLRFPTPVGLAAGFDKDAEVPERLLALGFGFVEVGGVTPLPQPGNPKPRAFRLVRDRAVINRYGLNSAGMEAMRARLSARRRKAGIVGVNIGANKESADRVEDYATLVKGLAPMADYISVNISSPNTPGLRTLQDRSQLDDLLARIMGARESVARSIGAGTDRLCPILVKIAPDLDLSQLDDMVAVTKTRKIDGLIISNTTIGRPNFLHETSLASEAGGLSGRPVFRRSTVLLAQAYQRVDGAFPLIGVGGIESAETAIAKIEAGASLVQLYTALVYLGPALIGRINAGLSQRLAQHGLPSLGALVGRKADDWAMRNPEDAPLPA